MKIRREGRIYTVNDAGSVNYSIDLNVPYLKHPEMWGLPLIHPYVEFKHTHTKYVQICFRRILNPYRVKFVKTVFTGVEIYNTSIYQNTKVELVYSLDELCPERDVTAALSGF